ncbi:hypothetical protein MTO96_019734 [Rhipicephalus appendiculatus]
MDTSITSKKRKSSRKKSKECSSSASRRSPRSKSTGSALVYPQESQGVVPSEPQSKGSISEPQTNATRIHGCQALETMPTEKVHQPVATDGVSLLAGAVGAETKQPAGGVTADARLAVPDSNASNEESPAHKVDKMVTAEKKTKHEVSSRSKSREERRRSKAAVGSDPNDLLSKVRAKKNKQKPALTDGDGKDMQAKRKDSEGEACTKVVKAPLEQLAQRPAPAASKLTEPSKQVSAEVNPLSGYSLRAQNAVPASREPPPLPSTSAASKQRIVRRKSEGSTQAVRRKHSVVSFGVDVKEPPLETKELSQLLPQAPMALAHLEEMAAKGSMKRRRPTIHRTSSLVSVPGRVSSLDIGDQRHAVASRTSRRSAGSLSSIPDTDLREKNRQTFAMQRTNRLRSFGADETVSRSADYRPSVFGSQIPSQFTTTLKRTKTRSVRMDVHNAFLLGPSLMTVLGNICSFHEGGNKRALRVACHVVGDTAGHSVGTITWAVVTLPGAVLALVTCTTVIWLLYVRPHEPSPLSPENLTVIRAAQERNAVRGKQKGVEFACATYLAILTLSYAPSLVLGLEQRVAVAQFKVASKLLQTHGLAIEAFKLFSVTFWEERSVLEAQAMLGFAASVMAETTDKQVIVDIMAPMVLEIAELKQMYPAYYAIPVVVGASSNFIMPASVPLAILHDLSRVSFWKLLLLGLFAKIVVMSMVIVSVNVVERAGFLGGQTSAQ